MLIENFDKNLFAQNSSYEKLNRQSAREFSLSVSQLSINPFSANPLKWSDTQTTRRCV